jgi:ribosomal protein L11 methyltransferase
VANILVELGSIGVAEGLRVPWQPQPLTTEVQGFFPADADGPALCETLTRYLHEVSAQFAALERPCVPQLSTVTDEAWHERWRDHFPPVTVGKRFFLLPPWQPAPADTERMVIVIEPRMAFGTGHHATTQGCLEAIERLHDKYGAPDRAFDLGTGSGILAIALAMLGTQRVWATDTDPIALEEACQNSQANGVMLCIHFSDSPIERLPLPFPLVVANLFSTTLVSLAPMLQTAIECKGYGILSGIQIDQEADVHAAYASPCWHLCDRLVRDEWVTLTVQRR